MMPRLPEIARVPAITAWEVKVQMKTPVTRKGMKSGTPRLVPSSTPNTK